MIQNFDTNLFDHVKPSKHISAATFPLEAWIFQSYNQHDVYINPVCYQSYDITMYMSNMYEWQLGFKITYYYRLELGGRGHNQHNNFKIFNFSIQVKMKGGDEQSMLIHRYFWLGIQVKATFWMSFENLRKHFKLRKLLEH